MRLTTETAVDLTFWFGETQLSIEDLFAANWVYLGEGSDNKITVSISAPNADSQATLVIHDDVERVFAALMKGMEGNQNEEERAKGEKGTGVE